MLLVLKSWILSPFQSHHLMSYNTSWSEIRKPSIACTLYTLHPLDDWTSRLTKPHLDFTTCLTSPICRIPNLVFISGIIFLWLDRGNKCVTRGQCFVCGEYNRHVHLWGGSRGEEPPDHHVYSSSTPVFSLSLSKQYGCDIGSPNQEETLTVHPGTQGSAANHEISFLRFFIITTALITLKCLLHLPRLAMSVLGWYIRNLEDIIILPSSTRIPSCWLVNPPPRTLLLLVLTLGPTRIYPLRQINVIERQTIIGETLLHQCFKDVELLLSR